jgi:putative transposase
VKKSRFTESQIVAILKELDAGTSATELGRKHGIHANTIRLWRDRYAGLESSDLVRLKQLEEESRRNDRVIARLTPEATAFERGLPKTLRFDNGAELTSNAMLRWGAEKQRSSSSCISSIPGSRSKTHTLNRLMAEPATSS